MNARELLEKYREDVLSMNRFDLQLDNKCLSNLRGLIEGKRKTFYSNKPYHICKYSQCHCEEEQSANEMLDDILSLFK